MGDTKNLADTGLLGVMDGGMDDELVPARVTPPGEILAWELEERGLTQKDLAAIMKRPGQAINEIVRGTKQITPDTALELSAALGTSPEFWLNLEANYRLHLARNQKSIGDIARRSRLYELVPLTELVKRRWLKGTQALDDLEAEVCAFLGIRDPADTARLAATFRQGQAREQEPEVVAQTAWLKRVEQLAGTQNLGHFKRSRLPEMLEQLLTCATRAEDVARVPAVLAAAGIHFVVVPHLPRTYLDGAAFEFHGRPVVALTLRHDRIDAFWFTLLHELAHVACEHQGLYLDNLDMDASSGREPASDGENVEGTANQQAKDWLIDPAAFATFASTAGPQFSPDSIIQFSRAQQRHPGIVVGRLQYDGLLEYRRLRKLLVKVKPFLNDWIDAPAAPQA